MENELARELLIADKKIQYDTQCKRVLRQRIILAWILKYTTREFKQFTLEEICGFIEEMPEVSSVATAPGETNRGRAQDAPYLYMPGIEGLSNEDKVPDEGSVFYDIRFYALLPAGRQRIRIIMNVEAQRSFYPGYEIVTRGIYYAARMISAQLGTEFVEPDYDNIKKVYSIWLCMNAPQYIGNAISVYHFAREELETGIPDKPQAYDKLAVCIVTLNEHQPAENELLKMLNTLLSPELGYEEKTRTLAEKFGLPLKRKSGEELNLMCNLSEYVYEKGIEKGVEKGAEAVRKELLKNMKKEGYTDEAILKIFQMTPEKLAELKMAVWPCLQNL